ncbi:hypothetical protein F2Q68_00012099 [Brassica cretica]|uniref:Uncharacterized protein n=2 Tax=Brassica TaxID=3705 RepID=A0A8S9L4A8_BRACR|nr:hypothetical protein F2Q68_00012099 [Brassica cretica]
MFGLGATLKKMKHKGHRRGVGKEEGGQEEEEEEGDDGGDEEGGCMFSAFISMIAEAFEE